VRVVALVLSKKKLFICINQSWMRKARPVPRTMLGAPSSVCYNFSSSLNPFPCFVSLLPAGTNEWRSSRPCCEAIWDRSLILVQRATVEDEDDNHPWALRVRPKYRLLVVYWRYYENRWYDFRLEGNVHALRKSKCPSSVDYRSGFKGFLISKQHA
jgi:hypothetical protein